MKKKLLLVEDEERLGFVLKVFFEKKTLLLKLLKMEKMLFFKQKT